MEVALSFSRLYGNKGLENSNGDIFHYTDRITKISLSEVPQKQTLVLACLGDTTSYGYPKESGVFGMSNKTFICSDSLKDAIIRFNNSDPDYKIELRSYIYSSDEERTRLLIELATGNEVDLLDTSLLPDDAADGSLLVDMLPYLEADEDISQEDFIPGIFADMTRNGGLYEYVDRYNLITVTARDSFAEEDWTVDAICGILDQNPDLRIENDVDKLCYYFAWAASAEFMDYTTASCSFTSEAFEHWLILLKRLCQTDYQWDSDKYTGEYAIYIDNQLPANAGISSRRHANGEYTVVGFPESGGTGTYFMRYGSPTAYGSWSFLPNGENVYGAVSSIGIMASSANIDGAWRFIKTYMSGAEAVDLMNGIPAQKAAFERAIENKLNQKRDFSEFEYFNESDAAQVRDAVYNTSSTVSSNETVISTIMSTFNAYLAGQYTEDAASAQLQSRLSIYLAEQYG